MKEVWDAKMLAAERIANQHRLVVSKMVMWTKWRTIIRPEKRTKWWTLREKMMQIRFKEKVLEGRFIESEGVYEVAANKMNFIKFLIYISQRHITERAL